MTMINFHIKKIGELGKIITGKTPPTKKPELYGKKYSFITPTDIKDNFPYCSTERFLSEEGRVYQENSILPNDAVCFTCIASIGKMCIVQEPSFTNQQINSIIVNKDHDFRYIYYLLRKETRRIINRSGGVASPIINKSAFSEIQVIVPQNKHDEVNIANILWQYDLLIENNLKRIKLFEQMAELIYDEWFVKFEFPGHEHVKMVDSELGEIPEGWEVKTMNDISQVIDCLHAKKPEVLNSGSNLFLQLENIGNNGKINLTKKFYISNEDYQKWTSRIEVCDGDCVITNVGRVGAVAQIPAKVKAAIGRNMTAIRPTRIPASFLIQYLLSKHMLMQKSVKVDSGTIMDALNVRNIYKLSLTIPDINIMNQFDNLITPIRKEINILLDKNINLTCSRDILLPKLISGALDVSHLDIKTQEGKK